MEVGIITFHKAVNYGAILQTYALQKAIKDMGVSAYVLDHNCKYISRQYYPLNIKSCRTIKSFAGCFVRFPFLSRKNIKFNKFLRENCNLKTNKDSDDIYITGSDQVWNYSLSNFDKAYFLNFVKESKKKNAYAASFGFDSIPTEYFEEYKELLKTFSNISVRESQGVEILEELIGRKVLITLDPTLLLNKEKWSLVAKKPLETNYILLHLVTKSPSIIKFAENLSEVTKCQILFVDDGLTKCKNAKYLRAIGPDEWIGYIMNSKYVVTNSFHATAFSINFNKQFFTELLPPPSNVNSRLANILRMFDLQSREIKNGKNPNILNKIEFGTLNRKLEQERKSSMSYLESIVFQSELIS